MKTLLYIKNKAELAAFTAYIKEKGLSNTELEKDVKFHLEQGYTTFSFSYCAGSIRIFDCPSLTRDGFECLDFAQIEQFCDKPLRWKDLEVGDVFEWASGGGERVKISSSHFTWLDGNVFNSGNSNNMFRGMVEDHKVIKLNKKVKLIEA